MKFVATFLMMVAVLHCTRHYTPPTKTSPAAWVWMKPDKTECARMTRGIDNGWTVQMRNPDMVRSFGNQSAAETIVELYCTSDNKNKAWK